MNKLLFVLCVSLISINCISEKSEKSKTLFSSITLEDGFENDTISIIYDNKLILKEQIVSSSKIVGTTDVRLEVFNSMGNYIIEDGFNNQIIEFKSEQNEIPRNFVLILNNKSFIIKIDTGNRHIGVSKTGNDRVNIEMQSDKRYYD